MGNVIADKVLIVSADSESVAGTFITDPVNLEMALGYCAVISNTIQTPAAIEFSDIDTVGGKVFRLNHGYANGLKVRLTTTGTLPTGLELNTDYYVSNQNSFGFELNDTKSGVLLGEYIEFIGGTGTHTITPQVYGSTSIKMEATVDNENYAEVSNSLIQSTQNENVMLEINNPLYRSCRLCVYVDSGQTTITIKVLLKGNHF